MSRLGDSRLWCWEIGNILWWFHFAGEFWEIYRSWYKDFGWITLKPLTIQWLAKLVSALVNYRIREILSARSYRSWHILYSGPGLNYVQYLKSLTALKLQSHTAPIYSIRLLSFLVTVPRAYGILGTISRCPWSLDIARVFFSSCYVMYLELISNLDKSSSMWTPSKPHCWFWYRMWILKFLYDYEPISRHRKPAKASYAFNSLRLILIIFRIPFFE